MKTELIDKFIAYFSGFMPLSEEEEKAIRESTVIRTAEKGTILLREGQVSREPYFILKGCVRQYYIVDGEEKTTNFFTEEQWVISLDSYSQQKPASHYFSCVEDSVLVVGSQESADELYRRFPKVETLSRTIVEKDFAEQQKMMASYVTDTPEQRYLNILKTRPELIQRVPQYQLASFIGVKPESLSRIRKRIAQRKKSGP